MYSAWTIMPIGGILLIVLWCWLVSLAPGTYRVHQVGPTTDGPYASPFMWAVHVKFKYWPWWMIESSHETKTDANYAMEVLEAKQRKTIAAHPEKVPKLEAKATEA